MGRRSVLVCGAVVIAWLAGIVVTVARPSRQDVPPAAQFRPVPAPAQPIAYSHRAHVEQGLVCVDCHVSAAIAERATLPPTSTCMSCHNKTTTRSAEIEKLAGYDGRKADVPWARVYRLPEYVFFSHQVHVAPATQLTCDTCHGDVATMDATQKVRDTSMAACMECHRATSAPNLCDSCHEPL